MPAPPEDAVVADLRATLLSSKTPLRIQDVNSDYKLVNGTSIPFREFGHSSLEEFLIKLKNKGEITMKSEGGNLLVHAAAKASSAHVLKLISKQKDSTKKRSFRGRHGRGGRGVGGGRGSRGGRGGSGSSRGSGQTSAYVSRPPPTSKSYQTSNYQSHNGTRSGYSSGSNYPSYQSQNGTRSHYNDEATQKSGQQGRIYGATPAQDRLKDRLKKLTLNLVEDPQPKLPSYLLHKDEIPSPPLLVIPESDRWDVFVTVAKSTTDVWIKLIGENFSDKFDDLSDEMSLSLADFDEDDHVVSPKVGHYYAVKDGELWNRVKLLSMKGDSCECHLIDVGETDNFSCNELFDLDPLFLDLAAQAVPCTLLNLEKYVGLQSQAYLNVIKGNSFVAVVKSRKMPHSIELYGTGSQDNIHMGEELLLKLDAKNSAPLLPPVGHIQRGDVKTFVSHVSDSGEVALQFHSYHFMIVHDLIESITPEDESRNKVTKLSDISPGTSCLARFSGEAWYRATIVNVTSETDIEVYSQDFGDSHSVPMSELLSLEKLPTLLSLILPQAVTVNLDCLPPAMFSEKLAEKIRKIVPEDEEVLVKTVKGEEIPIVELFIRIKPTNVLVSVNNTILVDPELTKSES